MKPGVLETLIQDQSAVEYKMLSVFDFLFICFIMSRLIYLFSQRRATIDFMHNQAGSGWGERARESLIEKPFGRIRSLIPSAIKFFIRRNIDRILYHSSQSLSWLRGQFLRLLNHTRIMRALWITGWFGFVLAWIIQIYLWLTIPKLWEAHLASWKVLAQGWIIVLALPMVAKAAEFLKIKDKIFEETLGKIYIKQLKSRQYRIKVELITCVVLALALFWPLRPMTLQLGFDFIFSVAFRIFAVGSSILWVRGLRAYKDVRQWITASGIIGGFFIYYIFIPFVFLNFESLSQYPNLYRILFDNTTATLGIMMWFHVAVGAYVGEDKNNQGQVKQLVKTGWKLQPYNFLFWVAAQSFIFAVSPNYFVYRLIHTPFLIFWTAVLSNAVKRAVNGEDGRQNPISAKNRMFDKLVFWRRKSI